MKATTELCASTDPGKDFTARAQSTGATTNVKGGVWQATDEQGTSAGKPAGVAVDAIPLRELLKGTRKQGSVNANDGPLALRKGQHFQLEGRVYKCELPAKCATALFALKTLVDAADLAEKKPRPALFAATGKRKAQAYRPKRNLLADLRGLFVDHATAANNAFVATYNTAKKGPKAWGALPLTDPAAMAARSDTLVCDLSGANATQGQFWLKGDVYCDQTYQAASLTSSSPVTDFGGAWKCAKPLLCGDATQRPANAATAAAATNATTGAWTRITDAGSKLWAAKPDRRVYDKLGNGSVDPQKATISTTKAFDWAGVVSATGTGTFAFAAGDLASEVATGAAAGGVSQPARIYKCAASAAACASTKPSSDATGATWQLTTLKGAVFSAAEALARQPVVRGCFLWEAGYPFAKNDEVCDPARPSSASWTCLDALKCSAAGKPGLERQSELAAVWNLATTAFRIQAGTGRQETALATFKVETKPKEDAPVQCSDYDDLATGADVSTKGLLWCDQGRVYACKETATATSTTVNSVAVITKTYPCCSTGGRPSLDASGCWALTRSRGSVQKLSKAASDLAAGLPAARAAGRCLPGAALNHPEVSSLGTNAAYLSTLVEGVVKLEAGRACTDDATWKQRQAGAHVRPQGALSPVRANWPRNVKVIDQTFDGRTLDAVFAGAGYKDMTDRRAFLSVLAWFPGVCGPQKPTDLRDAKAACRAEFLGLLTFALAGEKQTAAAYQAARTDDDVAWWQQAFASRVGHSAAGEACWAAEVVFGETGANGPASSCKMQLVSNGENALAKLAAAEALSVKQVAAKNYYARGAGPLPVQGPQAYTEFSKAIFGTEQTLGSTPELVLTWGPRMGGLYRGGAVGALPWAVALWRYVTPQHPYLPSMHEVVSGGWTPRAHEVTAKLGAKVGDFCTMASLLAAMKALLAKSATGDGANKATTEAQGVWADVTLATNGLSGANLVLLPNAPQKLPHMADGALGVAYQALAATLGAPLPSRTAAYDYRCRLTAAWPTPGSAATDALARQKTWLARDAAGTKCKFVDVKTALSVWTEGDVARCYQSGTGVATATMVANRGTAYADVRATVCQLWDATNAPFPYGKCASGDNAAAKATKGCLACRKLSVAKCDATCQADNTKTQHAVWRCEKAEYCMLLDPDHATNASGATSGTWVLETAVVNAAVTRATTASKGNDVSGKLYKVLDPVYAAPVVSVDCVTYAQANVLAEGRTFKA